MTTPTNSSTGSTATYEKSGSLILNLLEMFGIDMGPMISVSETLQHFWMLATAIVFLRKKRGSDE